MTHERDIDYAERYYYAGKRRVFCLVVFQVIGLNKKKKKAETFNAEL